MYVEFRGIPYNLMYCDLTPKGSVSRARDTLAKIVKKMYVEFRRILYHNMYCNMTHYDSVCRACE